MPTSALCVQVPATSANLGPGFDCLGLAVDLYLRVTCEPGGEGLRIAADDPEIATDERNLVFRAMKAVFDAAGQPAPGLSLRIDNAIPLSRGLGSSAAAITAGLVLANSLCGQPFERSRLLDIGLPLEGHPDNLAPALFGGLQVASVAEGRVLRLPVALPRPPQVALFVPDLAMPTHEARRVLPDAVPRADAVFNTCRSSLLVAAMAAGDYSVLRWAMEDRLHQPYRAALFPELPRLIDLALQAGAAGAALSGAGSTILALCEGDAAHVAARLEQAGVPGRAIAAGIDRDGARLM